MRYSHLFLILSLAAYIASILFAIWVIEYNKQKIRDLEYRAEIRKKGKTL